MSSAPFRFRLERVRELRRHDEDQAKERLAAVLGEQLRGEAMLRAATARAEAARADSGRRAGSAAPVVDLVARQRYLERVERERGEAELIRDRAVAEVDSRRVALVAASQRRQALDRLRDRRRDEHRARAARAEGAMLDEIALNAHIRRRAG